MKCIVVFIALSLFSIRGLAQGDICGDLIAIDSSFSNAFEKVYNADKPVNSDRLYLKKLYDYYRKILFDNKSSEMASLVGIQLINRYVFILNQEKKDNEAMAEILFGMENFLENIERGTAKCYVVFKGDISYKESQVQKIVDNFIYVSTLVAFAKNTPSFAEKILMVAAERDLLGSNAEMYMASLQLLQYKITKHEIDDTCFFAAYSQLIASHEPLSIKQASYNLRLAIDNSNSGITVDPLKIITDPTFITFRPAMVKRYKYLNFYDYYIRLYKYQAAADSNIEVQHAILKMFLKTFNADKNNGINVDFLHTLSRGNGASPDAIKAIIEAGDKELIQLLADFILEHCSKSNAWFDDRKLIYGGYLCYYSLGDIKKANKTYKKVSKTPDDRFPKIE